MHRIKFISFSSPTQDSGKNLYFLYTLYESNEGGGVTARLQNLQAFGSEEETKLFLSKEFHPNFAIHESREGWRSEELDSIAQHKTIGFLRNGNSSHQRKYVYELTRSSATGLVQATLLSELKFENEGQAIDCLQNDFHQGLNLRHNKHGWLPAYDEE